MVLQGTLRWAPAGVFGALLAAGLVLLAIVRGGGPPPIIEPLPSLSGVASEVGAPTRVDLNYAARAELEALPTIGATTAAAIIERRSASPIVSLDELANAGILTARQRTAIAELVTLSVRGTPP